MTCEHEDLDCLCSIQQAYGLIPVRSMVLLRMKLLSILSPSSKLMAVAGIVAAAIVYLLKQARKLIQRILRPFIVEVYTLKCSSKVIELVRHSMFKTYHFVFDETWRM